MVSASGAVLLGSREPRVSNVPPYVATFGPEVVQLGASAGLVADGWQSDRVDEMCGVRPDGRWACRQYGLITPRQNGKGGVLELRALGGLYLFGEKLIMWSAHEYKTALEAFLRIQALIEGTYDLSKRVYKVSNTNGDEGITLHGEGRARVSGRQRLRFIARSKGSGRGFTGDLNFVDEAFAYTNAQQAALQPTVSARPNPQFVYASTPPLDAATGEPLFRLKARAEAGAANLGWADWGAPPGVNLHSREEWARSNPALGIRIEMEAVQEEYDSMDLDDFGRERLAVWPRTAADLWQVIKEAVWTAAADDQSAALDPVAFAVDVTPDRSWACIATAGRRPDGLRHLEIVEHRPGTSWVVPWLLERVKKWQPCAVVIDSGSPAASLLADLEAGKVEVTATSAREMAQACGAFYDGIAGVEAEADGEETDGQDLADAQPVGRDIRYLPHGALTAAVAGAAKRKLGDAWAWDRLNSSVDICPLVAGTLALWGHASRAHLVTPGPDPMFAFA